MGDSRSWGAEMEDLEIECKHGYFHRYFDKCNCEGCKQDRDDMADAVRRAREVHYSAIEIFSKTPRDQRDKIKAIKVKRHDKIQD